MGSRYYNYSDSPEYNINQEEVFDTSRTSFKNLWNILLALIFLIGLTVGFYEDFQDNELFFQSGLSCLDSKNLIIDTSNDMTDKYEVIRGHFQASIYEFRIFEDTRIGNDYKMLSSSDQLELHNKILSNLKDVKFQSNLIKSIDDWNSFVSTSQSIFNLTDLHIKSHDYAISLKNEMEATDLYINNIDENIKNKLILIDLYEEYYVEWDISTSAQQRASVDEKYITLINAQITKLDQSIGVLNQYNSEMNKTREVNALAYENLDLDKCNNEE
tara:strand:+ start:740 stop:1555 length:816 start_codon:yes stop_codon:yes gene_type:complete